MLPLSSNNIKKRSYDQVDIDACRGWTLSKKFKEHSGYMFDDTPFINCSYCSAKMNKPPLSHIASEWHMHNNKMLPDNGGVISTTANNSLYKLIDADIPMQFVNLNYYNVVTCNKSKDMEDNFHGGIVYRGGISDACFNPSYDPAVDFFTRYANPGDAPSIDVALEDGSALSSTWLTKYCMKRADACMNNESNNDIIRLGDMLSKRAASNYASAYYAVSPILYKNRPVDMIIARNHTKFNTESTAWFKSDFMNKAIENKFFELNCFPDYTITGKYDVFINNKYFATKEFNVNGIISEKLEYLCRALQLVSHEDVENCYSFRDRFEGFSENCTKFNGVLDEKRYRSGLVKDALYYAKHLNSFNKGGVHHNVIPDSINVNHVMKDMLFVPFKLDVSEGCDTLIKCEKDDGNTIGVIRWSDSAVAENDQRFVSYNNFKFNPSDATWGTHCVYCDRCVKAHRRMVVNGLTSSNGFSKPAVPNYNFFFELYRALPMQLQPFRIDDCYNDMLIVCQ